MNKLTKRKGFNFFRSYFDVYNELETDADKAAFIDALLDRQFMGIKPVNLKGMVKFAYISQTNSIDSQVKGYEDKTGNILHPTLPPPVGVITPPALQVEEKGKEKEEVKDIKAALPFQFMKSLLDLGADKDLVTDWIKVRKNKKATNSETAFKGFKNQLDISGLNVDKVLRECIEKSWSGFKAEWMVKTLVNSPKVSESGEKMIRFKSNANPSVQYMEESKYLAMKERNAVAGYIYTILE